MQLPLDKILKAKARDAGDLSTYDALGALLPSLIKAVQQKEVPETALDLVPIRCVTVLEVSVRRSIAEAVNHGEPYTQRGIDMAARSSAKNLVGAFSAVHGKKLTLGDFVAHGVSIGRMKEILSSLAAIFGDNIKDDLASSRERWTEDLRDGFEPQAFLPNLEETFRCLDRLLEVRHIVVHEHPRDRPYKIDDLPLFVENTRNFVEALHWVWVARAFDTIPRTQGEMNKVAGQEAAEVQNELDELRGGTTKVFQDPKTPKDEIEYHWDRFCDLSAQMEAGYFEPEPYAHGTMAPLLYASVSAQFIRWRISYLKKLRTRAEYDL